MILGNESRLQASTLALDTSIFIYLIQEHPQYLRRVRPIFEAASAGRVQLLTSALSLLEVLVAPIRAQNADLVNRYVQILTGAPGLQIVDIDSTQLRFAAEVRARFGVKTPDALQLSAAISSGCSVFITNDKRIPKIPGLEVLQLSDLR